jgi:predicted lipoprotein
MKSPFSSIFILLILLPSCVDNGNSDEDPEFDRQEMLENLGRNVIIPAYQNYNQGIIDLRQRAIEFVQIPNNQTLQTLREQFKTSYLSWQHCSFYEFGPAMELFLRDVTNTFPTNIENISSNIEIGSYDLNAVSNRSSIGFPAIDYLIFGEDISDLAIIIKYVDQPNRGVYLTDLVTQMKTNADAVVERWIPNGDNYVEQFITLSGTDATSSLGLLVNAFNLHFESYTKNRKIGTPLGLVTSGAPDPIKVEAYYSRESMPYAIENVVAMKSFYQGNFQGSMGIGFEEWLLELNTIYEGTLLSNVITNQFDSVLSSLDLVLDPYSATVIDNPLEANESYERMQVLSSLFEKNMKPAMGILPSDQNN